MRSSEPREAFEGQDAQFAEDISLWKLAVPRPGDLVPPSEKAANGVVKMLSHIVSSFRQRAIGEVGRPSPKGLVQAADHLFPRCLVSVSQPPSDCLLDGGNGLLRRSCSVVASPGPR